MKATPVAAFCGKLESGVFAAADFIALHMDVFCG